MARLGWIEGRTVSYERFYADDHQDRLPQLARDLVARRPAVIYAPPQPAAVAARGATSTIPIVFATSTDPIGAGLARSLVRPGGNATGVAMFESLAPKGFELLREIAPHARRVGLIGDPTDPRFELDRAALAPLLSRAGLAFTSAPVTDPANLETVVRRLVAERIEVLFTTSSPTFNMRQRVVALTQPFGVAVFGHRSEMADAGALLSYGPPLHEQLRRSAALLDKVLRGSQPGEMPIEQPDTVELVINLRVAKSLGLAIPRTVLLRADRVIE
jgi:ABC-type uncharacterized transport system substrate-binding protein